MDESYKVGNDVEMRFDDGAVTFYSDDGTLWPDWLERAGIDRWKIQSIRVAEGTVKLPEDARGYDLRNRVYIMFGGLTRVESIDLDGFDTSNVTNMSFMFSGCNELTALDTSSLDTAQATRMNGMFGSCTNLKELDLSSFDTSNVLTMEGMFYDCNNLTRLNLSGFDTSNVTNMCCMFYNCENLTDIDLSSFDTSHLLDVRLLFARCRNLKTVIMDPTINQSTRTDRMFEDCRDEIIIIQRT